MLQSKRKNKRRSKEEPRTCKTAKKLILLTTRTKNLEPYKLRKKKKNNSEFRNTAKKKVN